MDNRPRAVLLVLLIITMMSMSVFHPAMALQSRSGEDPPGPAVDDGFPSSRASGEDWGQYGNGPAHMFKTTSDFPFDSVEIWAVQLPGDLGRHLVVDGTAVYINYDDEKVFAFNATTGLEMWAAPVGVDSMTSLALWEEVVLAPGIDNKTHALDRATGEDLWQFDINERVTRPITVDGDTMFYTTSGSNGIHAVNLTSHEEIWNHSSGFSRVAPAVANGIVHVANLSQPAAAYGLDAGNGSVIWTDSVDDWVGSDPSVGQDTVMYGRNVHGIKAFNATEGGEAWSFNYIKPYNAYAPGISGDKVFVVSGDPMWSNYGAVHALNLSDGSEQWHEDFSMSVVYPPVLNEQYVFVSTKDGRIRAFVQGNGTLAWSTHPSGQSYVNALALAHERLYFVTTDNLTGDEVLHCYGMGPNVFVEKIMPNVTSVNITEHVLVSATIKNKGNLNATGDILDFFVDDSTTPSRSTVFNLSAQGELTSVFDWDTTGHSPGNHTITARIRSTGSWRTTVPIELLEIPTPNVYIHDLFAMKFDPQPGDQVEVRAVLKNNGTADAAGVKVKFLYGAVLIDTKYADVPDDDSGVIVPVIWDTTGLPPGTYMLKAEMTYEDRTDTDEYQIELRTPEIFLEVVDVRCVPAEVHHGESMNIGAKVLNKGVGNLTSVKVTTYIDDEAAFVIILTIPAGGHNTTSFDFYVPLSMTLGNHTVKVAVEGHENTSKFKVVEDPSERTFEITLESITDVMNIGDSMTIIAKVRYTGAEDADNITLILADDKDPNLDLRALGDFTPGETKLAFFTYNATAPGIFNITAYIKETGESDILQITVKNAPSTSFKVDIIFPTNNSVVSGRIVVRVIVKVPVGISLTTVELRMDGSKLGDMSITQVIGEYHLDLNTSHHTDGAHRIKAVAITTTGLQVSSGEVHLSFKNVGGVTPPTPRPPDYETTTGDGSWAFLVLLLLIIVAVCGVILHRALKER